MTRELKGALLRIERRLVQVEKKLDASREEMRRRSVFLVMPKRPPIGPPPKRRKAAK